MGIDEPGFDVAEQGVDGREERADIGAVRPGPPGCASMLVEGGIAAAIAGEPVGQEMRPGRDISGQNGAGRGRRHGDPGVAGKTAVLALDRAPRACPSCSLVPAPSRRGPSAHGLNTWGRRPGFWSGLFVLRPRLLGSPRPPMKSLPRLWCFVSEDWRDGSRSRYAIQMLQQRRRMRDERPDNAIMLGQQPTDWGENRLIRISSCTPMPPPPRASIQKSAAANSALARELGIHPRTGRAWKSRRRSSTDPPRPHHLATAMTEWEEALIVELRRSLALALDDIVEATRRCIKEPRAVA